ncbi:hypothetical protein, partial [Streptomyces boncukensis]
MNHVMHIRTGEAAVTLTSPHPQVTDWATRYFGPWWRAAPGRAEHGAVLNVHIDPEMYRAFSDEVMAQSHTESEYAKARTFTTDPTAGTVTAVAPSDSLAYRVGNDAQRLTVVGTDILPACLAAARIAREAVWGQLLRAGWTLMHASAVATEEERALLAFGNKGAGKSTTALLLARRGGMALLANDRIFARADPDRTTVRILPWPAAAALGLGLLDALGLYDVVREHLDAGEQLHPTQHQRVTEALTTNRRTPLYEDSGRELKTQLFPDQFPTWFGIPLATQATAGALLFPHTEPGATPAAVGTERMPAEADYFT